MVSLIIDRYCALCGRFANIVMAQKQNDAKIHLILTAISISSFLYSAPRYFELNISYNEIHQLYIVSTTDLFSNTIYMIYYRIIGSLIFYTMVPYIIVCIAFIKFFIVLKNLNKTRVSLNVLKPKSIKENESNSLLIALSIRFLLSRLPTTLVDVYEMIFKNQTEFLESQIAMIFVFISNFLVIFSSASTFFLFLTFSCRFRTFVYNNVKILFKLEK